MTGNNLFLACRPDNDLHMTLGRNGSRHRRFDSPAEAVDAAPKGSAVLILADDYPARTTAVPEGLLDTAAEKELRLYIEYPDVLPGVTRGGDVRTTLWERGVVASDRFRPALEKLRILALHDCHVVPMQAEDPDLVVARVSGFDSAVYGLPAKDVFPILFRHPERDILVAATKLSQFVSARYAPAEAWAAIWRCVLTWLCAGRAPRLRWPPTVWPSYHADARLPRDVERDAFRRGADWFVNARLFIHPSWRKSYEEADKYVDRVGPAPKNDWPCGDGSEGMLEGFNARIQADGSQMFRWHLRNDCMGEGSMAMAFSGALDRLPDRLAIAANVNDFIYFTSPACKGKRADPDHPSYGLVSWTLKSAEHIYYGDDNARSMLGTLAASALLRADRWDGGVMRCLLANLRTTDRLGFRPGALNDGKLEENGWRYFHDAAVPYYSPHYEAYLWACLLWAYARTKYPPFLDLAKTAIRMTMAVYPDHWQWTNGLQQERARLLLPLAWLVRVEDTKEHRAWLRRMAGELLAHQDACGAIREELGPAGHGSYGPPASNEAYGTSEATLIQRNGDPLCDLLYTTNFAFLGIHEAAAATGEAFYRRANERLAKFLCRIQARSESRPEFDGAWFRAFDFRRWEYWASNSDMGWGAWSIESGWTQAWIVSVLGMRARGTSLWDLTKRSRIARHMKKLLPRMIPIETSITCSRQAGSD